MEGGKGPLPVSVSLFLCSSGSNARSESSAVEGRRVSSKSPTRDTEIVSELLGETTENSVSRRGVIDLPFEQINDFFTYLILICTGLLATVENDEQVAIPDVFHLEKVADFLRVVTAILHSSENRVVRH